MKALNTILDIVAALLALSFAIPIGYVVIVASIFLGVEWYQWLALFLAVAFIFWRYVKFDA